MTTTSGKENFNFGKYEGHFKDGLRDGDGTFTWKNGNVYNGEWKCGLQDGLGALIEANGVASNGYWEDGVLRQGFEGSTWINIGRYERRFKDGSLAYGHGRSFDGVIRNERDGAAQEERDGVLPRKNVMVLPGMNGMILVRHSLRALLRAVRQPSDLKSWTAS